MLSAAGILVSRLDLQLSNFASVAMNYQGVKLIFFF